MKLRYRLADALRGALIYTSGDTIAALILGEWTALRMCGIALIGGVLYAVEIPNYFAWIDARLAKTGSKRIAWSRGLMAFAFFNPLWIARHILFINLLLGRWDHIGWPLLWVGTVSFTAKIPISLGANYLIQNTIPMRWRFAASATLTALFAIYYAVSEVLFR